MYSPIELAFVNVNPPKSMVLLALNDLMYPTLINDDITNCNTNVIQDFLMCMFAENLYSPCDVHSVIMCTDDIRNTNEISEFEMNEGASARKFVTNLIKKG